MTETEITRAKAAGTPNLNKALSQLQGELPRITKTKTGKVEGENKAGKYFSYEYSYADLGDVVTDVGPLMAKHGLAFHCGPTINPADRREMILVWSLLHESGEEKTGEWPLGPVNQKPQSLGSAITYGRRYCFTAATNIVLEDDDDGQRAQQDHGSRQSAADAWESASPSRPMNQGPRPEAGSGDGKPAQRQRPRAVPAAGRPTEAVAPSDDRPWLTQAIERAAALKSEHAGTKLWQETAARARAGEITAKDAETLQGLISARVEDLREKAFQTAMQNLSENESWRPKLEELADVEAARAALEELGKLVADSKIDMTRGNRISQAIAAKFPRATDREQVAS